MEPATKNLRHSQQKLQQPFRKTSTGQIVLSSVGPAFPNKVTKEIKITTKLNTFEHNPKKHY